MRRPAVWADNSNMPAYSVLIVDDEPGIRESLGGVLRDEGHAVVDLGTDTDATRIDYPDKAAEPGATLEDGQAERGVLVCEPKQSAK